MTTTYEELLSSYNQAQEWLSVTTPEFDALSFHQQKVHVCRLDNNLHDELSTYDPQAFVLDLIKSAAEYIFNFIKQCIDWMWNFLVSSIARLKSYFSSKKDLAKDVAKNEEAKKKIYTYINQPMNVPTSDSGLATPENPMPVNENPAQTLYIAAAKNVADVFASFTGHPAVDYSGVDTVEAAAELFYSTVNQLGRDSYPLVIWHSANDPAFDIGIFHTDNPIQSVNEGITALMDVKLYLVKGLKLYLPQYNQYAQAVWHSYKTNQRMPHLNDASKDIMVQAIGKFRNLSVIEDEGIPRMLTRSIEDYKWLFAPVYNGAVPIEALIKVQELFSFNPKLVDHIHDAKLGAILAEEGLKECVAQQGKALELLKKEFSSLGKKDNQLPNRLKRLLDEYSAMTTAMVKLTQFAVSGSGKLLRLSVVYNDYTLALDQIVRSLDEYEAAYKALDPTP